MFLHDSSSQSYKKLQIFSEFTFSSIHVNILVLTFTTDSWNGSLFVVFFSEYKLINSLLKYVFVIGLFMIDFSTNFAL